MSLSYAAEKLFELEKLFRELAADLQLGRRTWLDVPEVISRGRDLIKSIREEVRKVVENAYEESDDVIIARHILEVLDRAEEVLDYLARARRECILRGEAPAACRVDYLPVIRLENTVMKLIGEACAFKVKNTYTSALNDLAACIHRVAEHAVEGLEWREEGKCKFSKSATPDAQLFCKIWNAATQVNREYGLYISEDYEALRGWAVGSRVYLKVGSAEGHRAEVDLAEGTLKYYDTDRRVNETLAKILSDLAGLVCEVHDFGVMCRGVSRDNIDRVAVALSFATSMDIRMSAGYRLIKQFIAKVGEKVKELVKN